MQINLTNDDMDRLVEYSGLSKSRIHQIIRKTNAEIFLLLISKVKQIEKEEA